MDKRKGYVLLLINAGVRSSVSERKQDELWANAHLWYPRSSGVFGPVRFLLPVCRLSWFLYTLNVYAHFSSHFSQQLLMADRGKRYKYPPPPSGSGSIIITKSIKTLGAFDVFFLNKCCQLFRHKIHVNFKIFLKIHNIIIFLCNSKRKRVYSKFQAVQDICCRIFLSNRWWQKSDIWSQASYIYTILWVAFLDPSDSSFLFADFPYLHCSID
jgi:hypothetical protein